ncbi:MAG: sulfurtransferase TusA family protein [Oscillospiraceae bacterium]
MKTELDCLGDMCPVPVMKLQQCKNMKHSGDSVKIVTDHSCTVESVTAFCENHKLIATVEEPMNGIWEITVVKP